jgi:fructokinase
MSRKQFAVGIGEVLMDVFENGQATLGGAPFNVIFHLHQLLAALCGGEAVFVSAVGSDPWGASIRGAIAQAGMSTDWLKEVDKPTGSALVFENGGGAGFEIQADVAWDAIDLNADAWALAKRCDAVVFGSLAQRSEVSRRSIQQFVSQVKGHRMYDVNLRRNATNGAAGYNDEIIAASLKLATVVKMNDAELEEVARLLGISPESHDPEERIRLFMERIRVGYSLTAVAITRGSKGALLFSNGQQLQLADSALEQSLVHPVGAGDSFAAGLLFGIIQGWSPEHSLALANFISSYVVRHVSATPPFPTDVLAQIRNLVPCAALTATPAQS